MKKIVISILSALLGAAIGAGATGKITGKVMEDAQALSDKHLTLFLMMNQWVKVRQEGKSLSAYFEGNHFGKVAIYGMSYAGQTLLQELKGSAVQVAYGIDHNAEGMYVDINMVSPEDSLEEVDAVVVTAVTHFDDIRDRLQKRIGCPIISLEEILYEV